MAKAPAKEPTAEKKAAAAKKQPSKNQAPGTGFNKPVTPSADLAAIVGADPMPRSEVVSKMWEYIKKHELQNPANKREIVADDKLEKVFGAKKATMFEMNKLGSKHLS